MPPGSAAPRLHGNRRRRPSIVKRCSRSAGVAVIAAQMAAAAACTNARDSNREASANPLPTPKVRTSCEVASPAAWQEAIETSAVSTGGVSTVPLAVGRDLVVHIHCDFGPGTIGDGLAVLTYQTARDD